MSKRINSRFLLAVLLLVFACATFVLAADDFEVRLAALMAVLLGVWLIRSSNVHDRPDPELENGGGMSPGTRKRLGRTGWTVGVVSLLAAGVSYFYLQSDAHNGYHQVLAVYVFAGVGLACTVIWGYLAVKLLR